MAVVLVDRSFQEPKELGEIFDLLQQIAALAVDGKPMGEKLSEATALLPALLVAGEGISAIGEELKDAHVYEAAGAFAGRLAQALLKK